MRRYRTGIKRHRRIDGCQTKLEKLYPRNRTRLRVYSMMTIIMMIYIVGRRYSPFVFKFSV
jgi:hypothetical protein